MFQQYFIPWIVSQVVSIVILLFAIKRPVTARYILAVVFFAAGLINWYASQTSPESYMMYSQTALPLYRMFIEGWFSRHISIVIPVIATGQLLLATGLLIGRKWLALSCLGIIIFLLAIAPLGIGSAFPFSITVSIAAYLVFRHWQLRWGATKEEYLRNLPGDDLVQDPDFRATRAIDIAASPESVFPWIVQIGSKRAGWYSIDRMDNAGIKSSDRLLPGFMEISTGQFIPFTPDQKNGMWVKAFEKNAYILWEDKKGKASWLWYLQAANGGGTRLMTRLRTKYDWRSLWIIYFLIYDFGDIVMMSKCMKGIKQRAEAMNR